jgi:hypothetical protein
MSNRLRAERSLELGGRRFTLRLTLQALAEIEAAFEVAGLGALGKRLSGGSLGAGDIARLAGALVRGGGEPISDHDLAGLIEVRHLPEIISAIGGLFAESFGSEEHDPPDPRGPQKPPVPATTPGFPGRM